jgi:hypothetical protein
MRIQADPTKVWQFGFRPENRKKNQGPPLPKKTKKLTGVVYELSRLSYPLLFSYPLKK